MRNRSTAVRVYCGEPLEAEAMILGWTWAVLIYGWVGLEAVIAIATRTRKNKGGTHDRGTQLILWVAICFSFFAAGWAETLTGSMPFNHLALRIAALVLIVTGLVIRIFAIATLGKAFSANVAIRSEQTLQRKGLYRFVRHPSYLGMEIIFLAAGLWTHNWASLAIMVVLPTAAVLYRIHVEELALKSASETSTTEYAKTTKRLIPSVY